MLHDDDAKNNDERSIEVNADTMLGNESKLERANGGCG